MKKKKKNENEMRTKNILLKNEYIEKLCKKIV